MIKMNNVSIPSEEERFCRNIVDLTTLLHELISICHKAGKTKIEPALIALVGGIIENYDKTTVIENFIFYSYEFWDQIAKREEAFFSENCAKVFRDLPKDHVGAFKELFEARDNQGNPIIIDEDKDAIWDYFDSLIKICIKYVHKVRCPKMKDFGDGKGPKPVYSVNKFPDIKLQHYANMWKVSLTW